MTEPGKAFLMRHVPNSGDSLNSLIHRLMILNGYESPFDVLGVWRNRTATRGVHERTTLPYTAESFLALQELSVVPSTELYRMTPHRYTETVVPPDQPVGTVNLDDTALLLLPQKQLGRHFRSGLAAAWCPKCIAEGKGHQLIWQSGFATVCVRHKCLLMDRCSKCARKMPIFEVCSGECRKCGTPISDTGAASTPVSDLALTAQAHIQSWLDPALEVPDTSLILPDCSPRAAYNILFGLYSCVYHASDRLFEAYLSHDLIGIDIPDKQNPPEVSIATSHPRVTVAFHIMSDWPKFFFTFLDNVRGEEIDAGTKTSALGSIYMRWLLKEWKHYDFSVIKTAFEDYFNVGKGRFPSLAKSVFVRDNPSFLDSWAYISIARAAEMLEVSPLMVNRFIETGRLTNCQADSKNHDQNRFRLVLRSEVESLKTRWSESISLEKASELIGGGHEIAADLAREGLLHAERGPTVDGSQEWSFMNSHIDGFLVQIERHVRTSTLRRAQLGKLVSLSDAVRRLIIVEMTLVRLLKHVIDGELRLCRFDSEFGGLNVLQVAVTDVERLKARILRQRGWVLLSDISQRMHVDETVAEQWVNRGLLTPVTHVAGCVYFDTKTVDTFVSSHLFIDDAIRLIDVGAFVVQKWMRDGVLTPISGPGIDGCHRYLYRRQDVERLRPGNR